MNPVMHIRGRLLLNGLAGLFLLAPPAIGADTPGPAKSRQNSVIVYSRADMQSNGVTTLTRNDTFHIGAELWDSSRRWCAINSGNNQFIGYALCDQLENMKKRPADNRRSRHAAARSERVQPAKDHPAVQPRRSAASAPAALQAAPAAVTTAAPPRPAAPAASVTTPGSSAPLIGLVFITVFLLTVSSFCLFEKHIMEIMGRRYERKRYKRRGTDRGDGRQSAPEDESHQTDATAAQEVAGLRPGSGEAGPAAIDKTPEYRFWDCVIRKADRSAIGKRVKCQICGSEQPLADDFKCTECGSDMACYIEIPEKQRI